MITLFIIITVLCIYSVKEKRKQKADRIVTSNMPQAAICEISSGKTPLFNYPLLNYEVGEKCHFVDNARYFVTSNSTCYQRISNGTLSKGKNKWNRTNYATTYPVTMTVSHKYEGTLIVTNHRIIFNCDEYSLCIPLSCVITFTPYDDRVIINSGKNIDCIYVPNGNIVVNLLKNIFKERDKI